MCSQEFVQKKNSTAAVEFSLLTFLTTSSYFNSTGLKRNSVKIMHAPSGEYYNKINTWRDLGYRVMAFNSIDLQ